MTQNFLKLIGHFQSQRPWRTNIHLSWDIVMVSCICVRFNDIQYRINANKLIFPKHNMNLRCLKVGKIEILMKLMKKNDVISN